MATLQTFKVTLPSGFYVEIREMNGEDDNILTNKKAKEEVQHLNNFIAAIVVDTNLPVATNGKITREAAKDILLRDKYSIVFWARIYSIGEDINFDYKWDMGTPAERVISYTDNLKDYVWDFETPIPKKGEEGYQPNRAKPYPKDAYDKVLFTTTSGKQLRYHLLNSHSEKILAKAIIGGTYSQTLDLIARGLEYCTEAGEWIKVQNFSMFSKRDMTELYKVVGLHDEPFYAFTEVENDATGDKVEISLLQLTDFFFPQEM